MRLKSGIAHCLFYLPYFTYNRINLYLDLLLVIEFQHFIALWKAYNKSKQIAQFLQRNFAQIFSQTPEKGIFTFSVLLEYIFSLEKFCKCVAYLNSLGQGLFKKCTICCNLLYIICLITRFRNKYLNFVRFAIFFAYY